MKKRVLFALLICTSLFIANALALTGGGTADDPYLIQSLANFDEFVNDSQYWDDHISLNCDINLTGRTYNYSVIQDFSGVFNGNSHKIQNVYIDNLNTESDYSGFFGTLSEAIVQNLGIENISIVNSENMDFVGALIGANGMVHRDIPSGTIINCYATGTIAGGNFAGGLCGWNAGDIFYCHADVDITGSATNGYIGGLCGISYTSILGYPGSISNCYAAGDVSGQAYIGGLCGEIVECFLRRSFSTGLVTSIDPVNVGGLVASNKGMPEQNCFWNTQTSNQPLSAAGTGLTTTQMLDIDTYLNAGWDLANETNNGTRDTWIKEPGSYPILKYTSGQKPNLPGQGTSTNPYVISTAADLGDINYNITANYILANDIDLSGMTYYGPAVPVFFGNFNGQGHDIDNLTVRGSHEIGFFGKLKNGSIVSNTGLKNVDIVAQESTRIPYLTGGLSARSFGTVDNVHVIGTITGDAYAGGLCGDQVASVITNCSAQVNINAKYIVGGLIGYAEEGSIENCSASGLINTGEGSIQDIGGLCGSSDYTTIDNCSSTCDIICGDGAELIGGLCGNNTFGNISNSYAAGNITVGDNYRDIAGFCGFMRECDITNCYSTSLVTVGAAGTGYGGFLGTPFWGAIYNSFWNTQVYLDAALSVPSNIGDDSSSYQPSPAQATGTDTAALQTKATFTNALWDFTDESVNGTEDLWTICESTNYPRFPWQIPAGDFTCPDGAGPEDLILFANNWLKSDSHQFTIADITANKIIDIDDLLVLSNNWLDNNCGSCAGADIFDDDNIDQKDFALLAKYWMQTDFSFADLNNDGTVSLADFAIIAQNWMM